MKTLILTLSLLLLLQDVEVLAQEKLSTSEMNENVKLYNEKILELMAKNVSNGFGIVQESKLPTRSDIDMVINITLHEGNWYHFSFVGDPSSSKIKATLFLEGFGDLVQDRIIARRETEFWTEFSFLCEQSGSYELTLYQKCKISRPLSYLTVFKKL